MISSMTRFEIVGPKDELWNTLERIQDLGICHLDPAPLSVEGTDATLLRPQVPLEEAAFYQTCAELADQFDGMTGTFPAELFQDSAEIQDSTATQAGEDRGALVARAEALLDQWGAFQQRFENLREDYALLSRYSRILDTLDQLHVHAQSKVIPVLVDDKGFASELVEELEEICRKSRTPVESRMKALGGGSILLALAVPQAHEADVREHLWEKNVSEVVFPREYAGLPPAKVRSKIESRLASIPDEEVRVQKDLELFYDSKGTQAIALGNLLADNRDRYQAFLKAGLTQYAFQLTGWVPSQRFSDLEGQVAKSGLNLACQRVAMDDHATPPTHLKNPGFVSPFESLLGLFPPPSQGSIDPSMVMLFTFPLFFGWMVGDAGYGACMFLIALVLRAKYGAKVPMVKDVSYIFGVASLSAVFWGVVFGEYFGHLGAYLITTYDINPGHIFHHLDKADPWHSHVHLWIGRVSEADLKVYLGFSCLFGVLHMALSLVFGIYTALGHLSHAHDEKHKQHALSHALEKLAMLISLVGFVLIVIGGTIPDLAHLGQALSPQPGMLTNLGLGLVVLAVGLLAYALPGLQKLTAPIEGVAVLSNTISYSRLMAVGTAGVVLAGIANDFGRWGVGEGGIYVLLGLFGAVCLHLLALGIAIFDPMIQALRLHYVEFFSKFYESDGVEYTPLARKGGSSL